jgi:hypothetical protein
MALNFCKSSAPRDPWDFRLCLEKAPISFRAEAYQSDQARLLYRVTELHLQAHLQEPSEL